MVCQASRMGLLYGMLKVRFARLQFVFLGRIQGFDPTTGIFFAMAAISRWEWEDGGKMGFCWFLLAYWDNQLKIPENRCCIQKAKSQRRSSEEFAPISNDLTRHDDCTYLG